MGPKLIASTFFLLFLTLPLSVHGAVLQGKVVDIEGNPVPEALVWVSQFRQVRTFHADASGAFSADKIDVAPTEIVAYKPGFALGGAMAVIVGDVTVELILAPGDLITIKVLDTAARPVPGAYVRSMLVGGSFSVTVEDLVPYGLPPMRSDDDGILVVAPLPLEGHAQLVVSHPNYADTAIRYLPVGPEQTNILIHEGKRVGGRVTHNGNGVGEVRVSVFKSNARGQKEFAEVTTDSEGFFNARVEPGHYAVAVQHKDYASPAPAPVEVPAEGEAPSTSIALESPRHIRGRVVYGDDTPSGGVRILYKKGSAVYQDTYTDNEGKYVLQVPGGPGELIMVPPRGYRNSADDDGSISVELGEVASIELKPIKLKALPVITGTFRDEDGNDPGPVWVTILNLPLPYSLLTDEKGHLNLPLDFMPDVKTIQLRAEHGRRFQRADIEIDLDKAEPFDVKLEAFTPDLEPRELRPGINNLSGLVGEIAKPMRGTEWLNSDPVSVKDLKGKVVVLLFWVGFDRGIGPIVVRDLVNLHALFKDVDDVTFLGIHDATSTADEIREYVDEFAIPFPILRDENDQSTFSAYNIVRNPQVVLLDKEGIVRYYQTDDRLLTCIKGLRRE